jgi:hypothetical protein
MDNSMSSIADQAKQNHNRQTALKVAKQVLLERVQAHTILAQDGGVFQVTEQMMGTLRSLIDADYETVIMLDANSNPIKIADPKDFLNKAIAKYQEALNEYHIAYEKLKRQRSAEQFIDD